jgi:hypothetical protein
MMPDEPICLVQAAVEHLVAIGMLLEGKPTA